MAKLLDETGMKRFLDNIKAHVKEWIGATPRAVLMAKGDGTDVSFDGLPSGIGAYQRTEFKGFKSFDGTSGLGSSTNLGNLLYAKFENVTFPTMAFMFYNRSGLRKVDFKNIDTSAATAFNNIFRGCSHIRSLDLDSWNTSNSLSFANAFYGCSQLQHLSLLGWDTRKTTNMYCMFFNCTALEELDVSSFSTDNVTNMSSMFQGCSSLTTLDISSFNTEKVTTMNSMFRGCDALVSLNANLDTSKVANTGNMFLSCMEITAMTLGMNFGKGSSLPTIDFSPLTKWKSSLSLRVFCIQIYDRKSNGLSTVTLKFSTATKTALQGFKNNNGQTGIEQLTAKGYTIA